jgi:predicted Rossmann-fold nucleotide-binding protein
LGQLHIEQKPIGLLNVNGFFDAILMQLDKMVAEGYLQQANRNMLLVATSVDALMHKMNKYEAPEIGHIIKKVVQ